VNDELLPNVALEPGFPRKISLEIGCINYVLDQKKGVSIDGHV